MSDDIHLKNAINHWVGKASESLLSAQNELDAGLLSFAVNRIYYACFYIVSAILLQKGLKFKKHSGVRKLFHEHLVKTNIVNRELASFYDKMFEARQRGDYIELVTFEREKVTSWLKNAKEFFNAMKSIIDERR